MVSEGSSPSAPAPAPGRALAWLWAFLGIGAAAGLWLLWRFEPQGQAFFPRCFLHAATGLECPGCGGLRATHALLHGDLASAWRLNPLLLIGLPLVGWSVVATLASRSGRRWPHPFGHPAAVTVTVVAALLFGVVRNVPAFRTWLGL